MTDVKYEILSHDEEIAGVKALPVKNTTTKTKPFWKSVVKYLLILSLAVLIVFSILGMAAYHFWHHAMYKVGEVVLPQITTEHPLDLPMVRLPHHEIHDLKKRLHSFHHDLHHGRTPEHDLVLTEREVNGLICHDDHGDMCGHAHVTMMNNKLVADFSFPVPDHAHGGQGRYLVGKKTLLSLPDETKESFFSLQHTMTVRGPQDEDFTVINAAGTVDLANVNVEVQSAEVFGWMAMDAFVERFFQGRNWAAHMCPDALKAIDHIAGVYIGDGKIVVRVK